MSAAWADWYGDDCQHLGPDDSGLEMFREQSAVPEAVSLPVSSGFPLN